MPDPDRGGAGGGASTATARPLVWAQGRLAAGPAAVERVTWSVGGRSLLAGLRPGDQVALHWDWVCDVLTDDQVRRITAYEQRQLTVIAEKPVVTPV